MQQPCALVNVKTSIFSGNGERGRIVGPENWGQVRFKYLLEYKPTTISRLTLHTAGHNFPFSTDFCNFSRAAGTGMKITINVRLSLKQNYFEFLYIHFGKSDGELRVQDANYSSPFPV